jgi:hypothetical protein
LLAKVDAALQGDVCSNIAAESEVEGMYWLQPRPVFDRSLILAPMVRPVQLVAARITRTFA